MKLMVFTDLDATLLDHDTYSWDAARPALDALRAMGAPVVLASSKTRAEMEFLRAQMENTAPFICENGGGVVIPPDETIVLGARAEDLLADLDAASAESGVAVRPFARISDEELHRMTNLPLASAHRARLREFSQPFVIPDGDPAPLLQAIEKRGRRWTRGGRFWHITGDSSKARAVRLLVEQFRPERTVALGDAPNDLEMLREAGVAVLIPGPHTEKLLRELPGAIVAPRPGPAGWNAAILGLL